MRRLVLAVSFVLATSFLARATLVWTPGSKNVSAYSHIIGNGRIVSMEALPEENEDSCEVPTRTGLSLAAPVPRQARSGAVAAAQDGRPSGATRAAVAERTTIGYLKPSSRIVVIDYEGGQGPHKDQPDL